MALKIWKWNCFRVKNCYPTPATTSSKRHRSWKNRRCNESENSTCRRAWKLRRRRHPRRRPPSVHSGWCNEDKCRKSWFSSILKSAQVFHLFPSSLVARQNKLECLSLKIFSATPNIFVCGRGLREWGTLLCFTLMVGTWGGIFSHVQPFYEWAVSNLDRSMHRSLLV